MPISSVWAKAVCRLLIALAISTSYSSAQAALIGTGAALERAPERGALLDLLGRADVARELQALGIEPAAARERVAALSDEEVRTLSGRISALPTGADVAGILLLVVVVALIWWLWKR